MNRQPKLVSLVAGVVALTSGVLSFSTLAATPQENRSLNDIYKSALKEGGVVTLYAGGDTPGQQDGMKKAFEQRFPGMTLNVIVDYSKYHDARIDNQLTTNTLIPDVVQLQTLQDFPRWKEEGVLMNYKPSAWNKIWPEFRDKDGAWTGIFVDAFSNVINSHFLQEKEWPREASDYLRPDLKGKIVVTYPNDDDAVLFWFKQVVDKYGWSYVAKFHEQKPIFVRGTQAPADDVESGKAVATFSTDGALVPDNKTASRFVLPVNDPFVSWAQRAAIFKQAKHPEGAKLYLNWLLDKKTQKDIWYMWSVRTDVAPPEGYKHIWEYHNTNPEAFVKFMSNRDEVERFRTQMGLYLGEVKGEPSPGWLGLYPDKPLTH